MVCRAGSMVGMCWMRPRTQGALLPARRDLHDCTLGTRKTYSFIHSSTLVTQRQSKVDQWWCSWHLAFCLLPSMALSCILLPCLSGSQGDSDTGPASLKCAHFPQACVTTNP